MKRRDNGEGSFWFNPKKGLYLFKITYPDENGVQKRKSFYGATLKAAREKALAWKSAFIQDNKLLRNPLVKEWIPEWLEVYVKGSVRPATYEKYKHCLKPICAYFGEQRLNELDAARLQKFFNQQLVSGGAKNQGISTLTVRNQRRYLSSCIETAIRLGITATNPVKLTKPPRIEKAEIQPLTAQESQSVKNIALQNLEKAKQSNNIGKIISEADLFIGIYIALETGMRLGEIMGLKWSDIAASNFITVQRSKSDVKGQDLTTPKTGIGRKIQISSRLYDALMDHKEIQRSYIYEIQDLYNDNNFIIGGVYGNGYNKRHYSSRKFQKVIKEAGITRHIRFHDLRHTHATLLLLAGVNPKIVQERLGHSSINMTLDTYSHLTLANQDVAILALEKLEI